MELVIINISILIYLVLGEELEFGVIFICYLVFRVYERVIV